MKKYKLIKEYPGSYKLGYTIIGSEDCVAAKFPEFWQEIIEKDYEILSFTALDKIFNKKSDSIFRSKEHIIHHSLRDGLYNGRTEEYLLRSLDIYKIHSVKRLSDGEVFTVGDKIEGYKNTGIKEINLYPQGLRIITDANGDGCLTDRIVWLLKDCLKTKQKLFTTEDGVDIFRRDLYYYFIDKSFEMQYVANPDYMGDHHTQKGFKAFSTKEKAEEYIIMNKPCLSINDILSCTSGNLKPAHMAFKKLNLLVKQKVGL